MLGLSEDSVVQIQRPPMSRIAQPGSCSPNQTADRGLATKSGHGETNEPQIVGAKRLADQSKPRRHRSGLVPLGRRLRSGTVALLPGPQVLPQSSPLTLKRGDALLRCRVRHSGFDAAVPTHPGSRKVFHGSSMKFWSPGRRGQTASPTIPVSLAAAKMTRCTVLHTPAVCHRTAWDVQYGTAVPRCDRR